MAPRAAPHGRPSEVRIIGGQWRGRRIRFPDRPGVRPTPDRVRETLFNWLQPWIAGSACLDLFAGSGAIGVEALSRGASRVVFVESDVVAARALHENLRLLKTGGAEVHIVDACDYVAGKPEVFDIVFLDPPFQSELLPIVARRLEAAGWIKPAGLIYIEVHKRQAPDLPPTWEILREKAAGQVGYYLARQNRP